MFTGVAGLLYVTTGVHGGHVLLGMLLILLYDVQGHAWTIYSSVSSDSIHGILSIVMYWHYVYEVQRTGGSTWYSTTIPLGVP